MKNIKFQKGFSLVEILIAVGLLGALSLGVMQISKMMSDNQSNATANLDIQSIRQEIMALINDGRYCTISLAGNSPPATSLTFNKIDIDDLQTEGIDIELWLSDVTGAARTLKKFSSTDSTVSVQGKAIISKLQLVMNNPTFPPHSNYPSGSFTDRGVVKIELIRKGSKKSLSTSIPINVNVVTDAIGVSKVYGCSIDNSSRKNIKNLVIHSQSTIIPSCPAGWTSESIGYSYVLGSLSAGYTASEDLSDTGSCLKVFGAVPIIECRWNQCDYHTGGDFSGWLWGGVGTTISRCNVCKKEDATIKVVHSQTALTPSCPLGFGELWRGYSLTMLSLSANYTAPMKLDGPGSCLKDIKQGLPTIECEMGGCNHVTGGDFAGFLTTRIGLPDVGPSSPPNLSQISRCIVCQNTN